MFTEWKYTTFFKNHNFHQVAKSVAEWLLFTLQVRRDGGNCVSHSSIPMTITYHTYNRETLISLQHAIFFGLVPPDLHLRNRGIVGRIGIKTKSFISINKTLSKPLKDAFKKWLLQFPYLSKRKEKGEVTRDAILSFQHSEISPKSKR